MNRRVMGIVGVSVVALLVLLGGVVAPTAAEQPPQPVADNTVYLPIVGKQAGALTVFGFETIEGNLARSDVQARARDLNVSWVRLNSISWREVQPTANLSVEDWNWAALQAFEQEALAAQELGLTAMVVVDDNPEWARMGDLPCNALEGAAFGDYGRFVAELVRRYSVPPYNVRYWELGNEPDVDPRLVSPDSPFGCWGDINDPYYGGEHYGNMLKTAYPVIKQANPDVQVVMGGLLLDTPETTQSAKGFPERFLTGVLRTGAGDSFDVLAFHSHSIYRGSRTYDADRDDFRWRERNGMVRGKAQFVRDVMQQYGISKPLMLNETALLYNGIYTNGDPIDPTFMQAQADHIVKLYARGTSADLLAICWYTLEGPGWRVSALLDGQQQPRPVYNVMQLLRQLTDGAYAVDEVTAEYGAAEEVEAYRFLGANGGGQRSLDTVWAVNGDGGEVALSAGSVAAAYTRDGEPLAPTRTEGDTVVYAVSFEPIFIARN